MNIYFKTDELLGDIYLTGRVARLLDKEGKQFERFLTESIARFNNDDDDGSIEIRREDGYVFEVKGFVRRGYKYGDRIIVLEKFFDRSVFFLQDEIEKILDIEEEQSEHRYIDNHFDELYDKALAIATQAHEGQTDKAGEPYIKHPVYVSEHVNGKTERIAALLHDVVEDSEFTFEDLEDFPTDIQNALYLLTRGDDENYGDYIMQIRRNPIARRVKIEDIKHNMDLRRLKNVTPEDKKRVAKYEAYLKLLETSYYCDSIYFESPGEDIRMVEYQFEGYDFHKAVEFARRADREHLLKAIEVNNILNRMRAPEHVILAGLLYCTLEMEDPTIDGINIHFGESVWETYMGLPWNFDIPLEDKGPMINKFLQSEYATKNRKLILLAIAIAELREHEAKLYKIGQDNLFSDNDEKLKYEEYFDAYLDGFEEFQYDDNLRGFYWTLQNLFKDVFVQYYISKDFNVIYQGSDLYCYRFIRGNHGWDEVPVKDFSKTELSLISREEAESLEDDWIEEMMQSEDLPKS